MKVNNFITLFNTRTKNGKIASDDALQCIVDLIKPKSYLPYDEKIKLVLESIEETKDLKPCWPYRNRLFIIKLLKAYTNLEVSIPDYDTLSQNLFIEPLLSTFEREYKICSAIMNNCLAEMEYSYG